MDFSHTTSMEMERRKRTYEELLGLHRDVDLFLDKARENKSIRQWKLDKFKLTMAAALTKESNILIALFAADKISESREADELRLAVEAFMDITNNSLKEYEFVQQLIMQMGIEAVMFTSINIFTKKSKSIFNKINKIHDQFKLIFENSNNSDLIKKFNSIKTRARDKIKIACDETQIFFTKKNFNIKSKNESSIFFRQIKKFINEKISYFVKIYQSTLSKFKILRKSIKSRKFIKKYVVLNEKNQTDDALPEQIDDFVIFLAIVKLKHSLHFNRNSKRKKKKTFNHHINVK